MLPAVAFTDDKTVAQMLATYEKAGGKNFSADRGKAMWSKVFTVKGEQRSCESCHTADLRAVGKHQETGKKIEPMSAKANPERYTDPKFIKKWFNRNCKWTLGRLCTAQEKGDYLTYLAAN